MSAEPTNKEPHPGDRLEASLKVFKLMLTPDEKVAFTVLTTEEFRLLQWCHRANGEKLDDWIKWKLLSAARDQVQAANAGSKPAPQGINEIVAGLKFEN